MLDPPFPQCGGRFHSLLYTENPYPFVPETLTSATERRAGARPWGCTEAEEGFLPSELLSVCG